VPPSLVVLDDRLLVEHLTVGLPGRTPRAAIGTTAAWWYRATRAAVVGAGGNLSGPFERLSAPLQEAAILTLLQLPDDVVLPDPRATVPTMAQLALRHPRLNLMNLEAASVALHGDVEIWLSEPASRGVLPAVLVAEHVSYRVVSLG
jgi:hypothetical protein